MDGEYGIVANVESDNAFRTGAKVRVLDLQWIDRVRCMGVSKSGRQITKIVPLKRLTNFRVAWVPEHLRNKTTFLRSKADAKTWATVWNDRWRDVRYFSRTGELLKDGKTTWQDWT